MASSPQTILDAGACYDCYGSASMVQLLRLNLLKLILENLDPMAATDPQSLFEYGKCFECYGASSADVMELALLDMIYQAGGGGGGGGIGAVMRGSGAPVAAPSDPTAGAVYYDDDSGSPSYDTQWHWSVPDQLWIGA